MPFWRLPASSFVQLPAPKGRLVLVTGVDSDETEGLEFIPLLNSDYSCLTADFCPKAPTSGLRKPCLQDGMVKGEFLCEGVLAKELWRRKIIWVAHNPIIPTFPEPQGFVDMKVCPTKGI